MFDKYILITGATGSLGRAVTFCCAKAGANVTLPYRDENRVKQLISEISEPDKDLVKHITPVKANLLNEEDVQDVIKKMPRTDILIHLMGGFAVGRTADTPLSDWQSQLNLNLTSAFIITKHVLRSMQQHGYGRIITIGSKAAVEAPGEMAAYVAAKAGLIAFTRSIAAEFKGQDITANVILPSIIDTPANRSAMGENNVHRWVTPHSLARIISYLISDAANDIRGAVIPVYGNS